MWYEDLIVAIGSHRANQATVETYKSVGFVRCVVAAVGYIVLRAPRFGRKRHMVKGHREAAS